MEALEAIFRWMHVFAGIIWIGHLYFFNWVNGPLQAKLDGPTKKQVVPELMPRALYFFRWGAAYTWITGVLMFGIIYSMRTNLLLSDETRFGGPGGATGIVIGIWIIGFLIYDQLWKALAKKEQVGVIVSFLITTAIAFGLSQMLDGRAMFIAVGGLFGTIMAANVWMRIWPAQ